MLLVLCVVIIREVRLNSLPLIILCLNVSQKEFYSFHLLQIVLERAVFKNMHLDLSYETESESE